jgi:thiol-disulfide isomerase/thioredoxin
MKWNVLISSCCVLLLAVNIALIHQNRQLKSQLSVPSPNLEVAHGTQMPDLKGFDAAGKPLDVQYGKDSRKVLVLVYSPVCGFCEQNWPKWDQLISGLDRGAVRLVAVDVTATTKQPFIVQHKMADLPVFVQIDPRDTLDYRFHLTPQTILLDRDGKVEKEWTGVLNDSSVSELKQLIGGNKTAAKSSRNLRLVQ